ncbi:MAG: hypothetical protein COV31_01775 [Candidatus Yanofskybacteria bacterium CG10_big_fil_rev_8_21_14_0_10_46_23]|uniref:Uncharacterized protein n=1 Tax=Candidatus Yanofskybacteria bacterium CG10_big_fil_rev_8_21_14_0_10_46_23 TaxID=1975098 RepID=A0A2H0R4T8_9BACT|nr:MAG: hypothetical protein COV31_01775 [Candidatus Yanofskybacteria bacterium CG10_big_fil_rev_8_21_14_0_10_46_23]
MKEYKERQYEIGFKLDQHTKADEDFHITASTVFSLANRASEIFESSEPREKQQLLSYLLQNCVLNGRKLEIALRSPYKTIVETRHQPVGLPLVDDVRTYFLAINLY